MGQITEGFITIEIVIALAILTLTIGGLAQLLDMSQSSGARTSLKQEALSRAEILLEQARSEAQADSRLLHGYSIHDDVFDESIIIGDAIVDPYLVRSVTAHVSWPWGVATDTISLSIATTDYQNASSFDTCGSLDGDWFHTTVSTHSIVSGSLLPGTSPSGHTFSVTNPVAGLDIYRGVLVVGVATTSIKTNDTLFVFDAIHWTYLGSVDTNSASIDGTSAVVHNGSYAFVANPHTANFRTCRAGPSCSQMQVVDIRDPHNPAVVSNVLIATSSGPMVAGSGGQAVGKSIVLIGTTIYLGLTKTSTGPEFNVFDVSNPLLPVWLGGYRIGAGVSAIDVRNGYAYIATDSSQQELLILDVRDPRNPTLVGSYNVSDLIGWGNGNSVYTLGTTTYLGLTFAAGAPDVYVLSSLNRLVPFGLSTTTASSTVAGMVARVGKLFVLNTTAGLVQLFDTSVITSPIRVVQYPIPGQGRVLDCERNTLYVGSTATSGTVTTLTPL